MKRRLEKALVLVFVLVLAAANVSGSFHCADGFTQEAETQEEGAGPARLVFEAKAMEKITHTQKPTQTPSPAYQMPAEAEQAPPAAEQTAPEPEPEPEPAKTYLGRYYVTGYDICLECCGKLDGITASGAMAQVGRTVAAPEDIPFGTVLYIDGIGERVVEDRGGLVTGDKLDVLCVDHPACYAITGWYDVYIVGGQE